VDDYNGKLEALKDQSPAIKKLFMDSATNRGLVFDRKAVTFLAASVEAA
jgi:hypothetical protein